MKKHFVFGLCSLLLVPFMTSCWTSIRTVAPVATYVAPVQTVYSTTVTTPKPKVTTVTTVTVTNYNDDWSFYLDLNAVAAAFAEARSVQEFEQIINSSRYMINNLDLNRDGWIDYLRVIETHRGVYHTCLIQACLGPSLYQDVATLVAEHRPNALYVEVIGDRWLYGPNYIVRPVFVKRPPIWDVFGRPQYAAWSSPYYYNYWPNYYQKPKPIYLNHYQAYVNTYLHNHHYCNRCDYVQQPFYSGYTQMIQPNSHNDYAAQHPNDSFEQRVTTPLSTGGSGVTVRNAGELRTETQRQNTTTTTTTSGSGVTQRGSQTTTSTQSGRSSQTTSQTTTQTSGTSQRGSQTTTSSSQTSTTQTSGTSQRSSQTSGTSTRVSGSTTRQPSTSVQTRVNSSGTTRTTIRTTDENGRTQTVQRTSSTSTRSSNNTSTRTSGTSTRSSGTSSRSSDSSVRSSQGSSSGSSPRSSQPSR